jgi:hypothetical protein
MILASRNSENMNRIAFAGCTFADLDGLSAVTVMNGASVAFTGSKFIGNAILPGESTTTANPTMSGVISATLDTTSDVPTQVLPLLSLSKRFPFALLM